MRDSTRWSLRSLLVPKWPLELVLNLTWVRWYGGQGVRTLGQEFNPCEFYSILHMVTCNCCLHHIMPCRRLWVTQASVRRVPDSCLRRIISLEKYNRKLKRLHTKQCVCVCVCVYTHAYSDKGIKCRVRRRLDRGVLGQPQKHLKFVSTYSVPASFQDLVHLLTNFS